VPSQIDGKPATATHFSINPNKASATKPIPPVEIPKDVNWGKPAVAVQAAKPGGEKAVVTFVEDGDTLKLKRGNGNEINCRIDTLDAPENAKEWKGDKGQPFGDYAKRTLQNLIANKEITLIVTQEAAPGPKTKANNYGRSLCKIEIEGENIDKQMIASGAAWLWRKFGKYEQNDPVLMGIEDDAREGEVGVWEDDNPEAPWLYRKRMDAKKK
jgi:endonuclease YncB( thermonuclease family)